ncbi:MAG: hypothetical protein IJC83_03720, partial [Oscillospiraceae bacterium]|nr:hypothetical protein [Oscillospiraceae bacterium]
MKKHLSLTLAIIMMATLFTACGASSKASDTAENGAVAEGYYSSSSSVAFDTMNDAKEAPEYAVEEESFSNTSAGGAVVNTSKPAENVDTVPVSEKIIYRFNM